MGASINYLYLGLYTSCAPITSFFLFLHAHMHDSLLEDTDICTNNQ